MNNIVIRRLTRRVFSVVAGAGLAATTLTGCLPTPPAEKAALCPAQSTYVPTDVSSSPLVDYPKVKSEKVRQASVEILDRLLAWPTPLAIGVNPIVTVHLGDATTDHEAAARALRSEFGSAIDITIGRKRLEGGPSGSKTPCLLASPTWAIWQAPPTGVSVEIIPSAASFDRHGRVTATLRVTNHTAAPIQATALSGPSCSSVEADGLAITSTKSAVALNPSVGLAASDAPTSAAPVSSGYHRVGGEWAPLVAILCVKTPPPTITIAPGAVGEIRTSASTDSMVADANLALPAGTYDLRGGVRVTTSSEAVVAAIPARVTLHD